MKLIFRGPVLTSSGYGVHSRQLLKSFLADSTFDVSVEAIKWGETPIYRDDPEFEGQVLNLQRKLEEEKKVGVQYDVSVQVTIPNEFKKMANVDIGVTAGIEVDRVSPEWLNKSNQIDAVVVPSKHSMETFKVVYQDERGNKLSLQKPLFVVPESFDERVFNTAPIEKNQLDFDTEFNFLFVGLGLERGMGEDRKNVSSLVKYFCEEFKGDKTVGLILKTSIVSNSLIDFEETKRRVNQIKRSTGCGEFPKIHIVHGRLSDAEMAQLYKHPKVKALVSITHGEGYGLPMLEAAACGLPVVATNWSGHLDFLQVDGKKRFIPVEFEPKQLPASAVWKGVMEEGTHWAEAKGDDLKAKLRKLRASYDKPKEWALELAGSLAKTHTSACLSSLIADLVKKIVQTRGAGTDGSPLSQAEQIRNQLGIKKGDSTLIYTMPMSAGDVFLSTGVVAKLREKFPKHRVFFATDQRYFDILKGNSDIDAVIPWDQWMANVPFLEKVFSEVYTPNLAVQMVTSNWVHGGYGKNLLTVLEEQCLIDERTEQKIQSDLVVGLPEEYIVVHPGNGTGQHEARSYRGWKTVCHNLKKLFGYDVVLVGGPEDKQALECDLDLRGKTSYNQLAFVVSRARAVVSIDSVAMHMASHFRVPFVSLFGSSSPNSTGPRRKDEQSRMLEATLRHGQCEKPCYNYQCFVDRDDPCINELDPTSVLNAVNSTLCAGVPDLRTKVEVVRSKIAGYTTIFNGIEGGYPFEQSIRSMLGFCDQVVVVDGGSKDGTLERLREIEKAAEGKVKVLVRDWDPDEPGMDGLQKAFARAMCDVGPNDFLWQQDADEVVHEEDYEKVRKLVEKFPTDVDILHLPVVELWGDQQTVRTDRHAWKWRLSRNNFRVTHGINKDARLIDEKSGKIYSKKGMSDGCEYIDVMTNEHLPHKGFWDGRLELMRRTDPVAYGKAMNEVFGRLPSVFHYSWADLPRKVQNFKRFWDKQWSKLYLDPEPVDRFPDVKTDEDVAKKAEELRQRGGEHGAAPTFRLERSNPASMRV